MVDFFNEVKKAAGVNPNVKTIDSGIVNNINFTDINGAVDFSIDVTCKYLGRVYKRVPVSIPLAGDEYGIYSVPAVGDIVILLFPSPNNPVVIGYVNKTQKEILNPKRAPPLEEGDLLIRNSASSQILMKSDGSIEITQNTKIQGRPSTYTTKSGIKIANDGSFKLRNSDGYGIEVNASGNVTLSGATINHTQSPISW